MCELILSEIIHFVQNRPRVLREMKDEAKDLRTGLVKGAFIGNGTYEVDAANSVDIRSKDNAELSVNIYGECRDFTQRG